MPTAHTTTLHIIRCLGFSSLMILLSIIHIANSYGIVFKWDNTMQLYPDPTFPYCFFTLEGQIIAQQKSCSYPAGVQYISSQGLKIMYQPNMLYGDYQFTGADMKINQSSPGIVQAQFGQYTKTDIKPIDPPVLESSETIQCYNGGDFYQYSFQSSEVVFPQDPNNNSNNQQVFQYSIKPNQGTSFYIGMKSILIWVNCRTNCDQCSSKTNCQKCLVGFRRRVISITEIVCEQFHKCTLSNCQSCWKGNTTEICASCFSPYKLSEARECVYAGTLAISCQAGTYEDLVSHTCVYYATRVKYFDQYQQYTTYSGTVNYTKYKCPSSKPISLYQWEAYASFFCGCSIENCEKCWSSSCEVCDAGFTLKTTNDVNISCSSNCNPDQFYDLGLDTCVDCLENCTKCSDLSDCYECTAGYIFNISTKTCEYQCKTGQYWSVYDNKCLNCLQANCVSCSSQYSCMKCSIGYKLDQDTQQCVNLCTSTQYFDTINQLCVDCLDNCLQCSSSSCLKCKDYFFKKADNPKICEACSVENCVSCAINSNYCQTCKAGYYFNSDNSQCNTCQVSHCNKCYVYANQCSTCDTGYFNSINECVACQVSNCKTCSYDENTCLTCNDGYSYALGKCKLKDFPPTPDPPSPVNSTVESSLSKISLINEGYLLNIAFSSPVTSNTNNLTSLVTILISSQVEFTYSVDLVLPKQMDITIVSHSSIRNSKISIEFKDSEFIKNNKIKQQIIVGDLPVFIYVSAGTREASQQIQSIGDVASTAVISSILPIAILSNFYILVNTIDITGFLYYLMFINIRHPENVVDFYSVFKNFQFPFIPNIFQDMVDPNFTQEAPPKFTEMSTDLYFIKNVGQTITIWIIIIGIYLVGKVLSYFPIPYLQGYLKVALPRTWEWSSFFDLLWNTYIYALMGVFLQFYCYNSGDSSYVLNYILHSICTIGMIGAPVLVFWLIYRENDIKNNAMFMKKLSTLVGGVKLFDNPNNKRNSREKEQSDNKNNNNKNELPLKEGSPDQQKQMISIDMIDHKYSSARQLKKEDISPSERHKDQAQQKQEEETELPNQQQQQQQQQQQSQPNQQSSFYFSPFRAEYQKKFSKYYNPILYVRKVLFSIVICYFHNYVFFQLACIIILNLAMLCYLLVTLPLSSPHENIKNCAGEMSLIAICAAAMFLVIDNTEDNENKRIKIGWVIVAFSGFILLWHTVQILREMIISLFQFFKTVTFYLLHIIRPEDPRFFNAKAKDSKNKEVLDDNHDLSIPNNREVKSQKENNDDDQKSDEKQQQQQKKEESFQPQSEEDNNHQIVQSSEDNNIVINFEDDSRTFKDTGKDKTPARCLDQSMIKFEVEDLISNNNEDCQDIKLKHLSTLQQQLSSQVIMSEQDTENTKIIKRRGREENSLKGFSSGTPFIGSEGEIIVINTGLRLDNLQKQPTLDQETIKESEEVVDLFEEDSENQQE